MAGGGKSLRCRRIYVLAVRFVHLLVVGRMLTSRYTQGTGGRDVISFLRCETNLEICRRGEIENTSASQTASLAKHDAYCHRPVPRGARHVRGPRCPVRRAADQVRRRRCHGCGRRRRAEVRGRRPHASLAHTQCLRGALGETSPLTCIVVACARALPGPWLCQ